MTDTASAIQSGVHVSGTTHWFNDYCGAGFETNWSNMLGRPTIEPQLLAIPGRPQLEWVPHIPRTRDMTVGLILAFDTEAACQQAMGQVADLIYSEAGPIELRRKVPIGSGVEESKINATYLSGFDPERVIGRTHRLALVFRSLAPFWTNVADASVGKM